MSRRTKQQPTPLQADEIAFLRENYNRLLVKEIATKLGRSEQAVYSMAKRLGVRKWRINTSTADFALMKQAYLKDGLSVKLVAQRFGLKPNTLSYRLRKIGTPIRTRSEALRLAYSKDRRRVKSRIKPKLRPSADLAYLIGFLRGDGYVDDERGMITAYTTNEVLAKTIISCMENIGLHPHFSVHSPSGFGRKQQYRMYGCSKIFSKWFIHLESKTIKEIFQANRIDFLRGFFDAEGTLTEKGRVRIYNSNYDLLLLCQALLADLNMSASLHVRTRQRNKKEIYYLSMIGGIEAARKFIQVVSPLKTKIKEKILDNLRTPSEAAKLSTKKRKHDAKGRFA